MAAPAAIASPLLARVRADQVATLYGSWHRTTASMTLGAAILCTVLWDREQAVVMGLWFAAILANQAWRGVLARAWRRAQPAIADAPRWGRYWAVGSTIAGALWGVAAVAMFPASPPHQALLIVCLFSVVLGGLNLTAVYKPSFYGFVLAVLVPLVARVAFEGDQVHLFTALVLLVVLVFVLSFGRQTNELLTNSLAIRYKNVDLIDELTAQTRAAESARAAAEMANRAKSQFLAAASHDLRQPLHAMGLFSAALSAKARDPEMKPLAASIQSSVEALEALFGQLLDLSRLDAGALHPERCDVPLGPLFARLEADFAALAAARGLTLRVVPTAWSVDSDPVLLEQVLRNLVANALRYTRTGGVVLGARRRNAAVRLDVVDTGIGIAPDRPRTHIRRVRADRQRELPRFRARNGARPRDRAPPLHVARPSARASLDRGTWIALFRDGATRRAAAAAQRGGAARSGCGRRKYGDGIVRRPPRRHRRRRSGRRRCDVHVVRLVGKPSGRRRRRPRGPRGDRRRSAGPDRRGPAPRERAIGDCRHRRICVAPSATRRPR